MQWIDGLDLLWPQGMFSMAQFKNDDEFDTKSKEFDGHIRNLSDLSALIMIAVSMVAGVAWGLKLDIKQNVHDVQIQELKAKVDAGILPITNEKLRSLQLQIDELRHEHNSYKNQSTVQETNQKVN